MIKAYLGIDIGSISTKGVVIDERNRVLAEEYMWTEGNPIDATKRLLSKLKKKLPTNITIVGVGVTGSARKLVGTMLNAIAIKNEITAHAIGTLTIDPSIKTILEIGGQDSKIIIIDSGVVVDYAMNTLCAAGTGSFLSSQAKRLGVEVADFGNVALTSKNPTKLAARCTVFAESDLVHKAQIGHKKEDIVAGLCKAVATNYLNNVGKGKKIQGPIMFQGGVSKNIGVLKAFEAELGEKIIVHKHGHLMGALGVAVIAKKTKNERVFDFDISDEKFETKGIECCKCPNHCEIITVLKNRIIIDSWGNKCDRGMVKS